MFVFRLSNSTSQIYYAALLGKRHYHSTTGHNIVLSRYIAKLASDEKRKVSKDEMLGFIAKKYKFNECPLDEELVFKVVQAAANQGCPTAQYHLAQMYIRFKHNVTLGAVWMIASARQENIFALSILGYMYERGIGVTQNLDRAMHNYQRLVDLGDQSAESRVAHIKALQEELNNQIN